MFFSVLLPCSTHIVFPVLERTVQRSCGMTDFESYFQWASFVPRPHPSTVGDLTHLRHGGEEGLREYERRVIQDNVTGTHLYCWYVLPTVVVCCADSTFEKTMLCISRAMSSLTCEEYFEAASWFKRAEHHSMGWKTPVKKKVICLQHHRCAKAAQLCLGVVHARTIDGLEDAKTKIGLLASLFALLTVQGQTEMEGDNRMKIDCIDYEILRLQKHVARAILLTAATYAMDEEKDVPKAVACAERAKDEFEDEECQKLFTSYEGVLKCLQGNTEHPPYTNSMVPSAIPLPVFEIKMKTF